MSTSHRLSRFANENKLKDVTCPPKQPPMLDDDTINNEAIINKHTGSEETQIHGTTSHGHQHSSHVDVQEPQEKSSTQRCRIFHHFHVPARFKRHRPPPLTAKSDSGSDTKPKLQASDSSVKNMKEAKLQFIKAVHEAIVEKFHSYAVVLTIFASITFPAILQPPDAFTADGQMKPSILVGCYMFFCTLSFFLACTGLLAVVSGTASMFRPGFFLNLDLKFPRPLSSYLVGSKKGSGQRRGEDSELDDPKVLAFLVLGNLHRAWRLRVYLVASLLACAVAFVCGAFAIMADGAAYRTGHLLAAATAVGGMVMVFEVVKSATGLTASYSGTWHTTFSSIPMLKESHHPWEAAVSNILRNVTPHHHPHHHGSSIDVDSAG